MRRLILLLIVAAALTACGDVVIGPVDHSCPGNPRRAQGSGCDDGGG